jgi:hypothetical protein
MGGGEGSRFERLRAELDRSLFPAASPEALRVQGWEGVVLAIGFLALAGALQFLRAGPESIHELFAEDGPVYLGEAITHGFFDSLTSPYAEYLVVLPRLIAELATILPLRYAPEVMSICAALFSACCGLAVWVGSGGLIRNYYVRALLVLLALLPPAGGLETVASATNVAWNGAFAVFWLLLWRPRTTRGALLGALMVLLTGLSSPAIFFFTPLAVLRGISVRDRRDAIIVGSFALALAIQLPVTALSDEHVSQSIWTTNILTTFLQRVVEGSALGLELGGEAWVAWGWPFLIAVCTGVAVTLAALALRASSGRLFALLAVATAVVMFVVSGYARGLGDVMVWPVGLFSNVGGRYAMIPALLLASAALVLVDSGLRSKRGVLPAVAIAAVLLVAIVTSFGGDANRDMPSWAQSLREDAAACRAKDATEATVAISPEGWTMTIPCDRLESEYDAAPARGSRPNLPWPRPRRP